MNKKSASMTLYVVAGPLLTFNVLAVTYLVLDEAAWTSFSIGNPESRINRATRIANPFFNINAPSLLKLIKSLF